MANKRLSDTAALVAEPFGRGEEHSISTRKIENGFITRTSRSNPMTGEYECREAFSKSQPRILPARTARGVGEANGESTLRETMSYLGSHDEK